MDGGISHERLLALIGAIYDCALDPGRWEPTLAAIREALDYASAAVNLTALPSGKALIDISSYARPEWGEIVRRSPEDVVEIWGGAENMMRLPLGEPLVLSRLRDRALWESNRLYREWGRAQGIHDFVAIGLMREAGAIASLAFVRHVDAGDVGDAEIELARSLVPHVQRAVAISRLLDARAIETARMAEALDALRCAVVLTDARARILHANHAALRMIREGYVLDVGGALRAAAPGAAHKLGAAIALAAGSEARIGRSGLAVRLSAEDAPPLVAHVLPVAGGELRTRLHPAAVAAVFVEPPPDAVARAEALATAYGLTRAETRLLARLVAGRTLAQAAGELRVAPSTVRCHLDAIFLKTGVARQAELIRLAAWAPPPIADGTITADHAVANPLYADANRSRVVGRRRRDRTPP